MDNIILLDRFFQKVHTHLVHSYGGTPSWPVILGIFGRPGDGKSAQLHTALRRCSVEIIRLNAADLESGLAGEPGKHVARTYATGSVAVAKRIPAALIIDDIDTTVGEWEMNTGTVNHQQVLAELMHLADQPVDPSRGFPERVPVFVTGNNLNRIYPPLRRPGRMNAFSWRPTPPEVRTVVAGIFAGTPDSGALDILVSEFCDEPLSFFAQVRQELMSQANTPGNVGHNMRDFLNFRNGESFAGNVTDFSRTDIIQAAKRIQAEHRSALMDFIGENGSDPEAR
jgi:hypothetical protein